MLRACQYCSCMEDLAPVARKRIAVFSIPISTVLFYSTSAEQGLRVRHLAAMQLARPRLQSQDQSDAGGETAARAEKQAGEVVAGD